MPWQGEQNDYQYGGGTRKMFHKRVIPAEKDEIPQVLRANVNFGECTRVSMDVIQDGEGCSRPGKVGGHGQQGVRGIHKVPGESGEAEFRPQEDSFETCHASDMVVQKLDEWLKHPTDSLSSIEFDNDIKAIEDYEFVRLDVDHDPEPTTPLFDTSRRRVVESPGSGAKGGRATRHPPGPLRTDCEPEFTNSTGVGTEHHPVPLDRLNFAETTSNMDIMLMTPQELERMPESGIEFEESVGPKETEPLLACATLVAGGCIDSEEGLEQLDEVEELAGVSSSSMVDQLPDSSESAADVSPLEVPMTEPSFVDESGNMATISVSTDPARNTTSIIINTELFQKSFLINTNNLMQAASSLQPITLADLVNQEGITVIDGEPCLVGSVGAEIVQENFDELGTGGRAETKIYSTAGCMQEEKCTGTVCTHTGRCKKTWTCPEPQCGKTYTKQCKLKVHMMMHTGVRPHKCTVDGCDWSFTTVYKLKRHLETHGGSKDFRCDYEGCNKPFTTIYNLNSHKKLHTQPDAVACSITNCSARFPNRRKMELHLREHTEVEAPYRCTKESCDKTFYSANAMASHLRGHQKTIFPCTFENCNEVFEKFSRFKTHLWRHTDERPYLCTHEGCGWAFSSASKRKRHMQKHTGERQFACSEPGCGKSFRRLEHMQGHAITHSGQKPFSCPHANCSARFTARSSLYVHLKKHTGVSGEKLVYHCSIENCNKKYNCKSSLRLHLLKYHTPMLDDANQIDYITWLSSEDFQEVDGQKDAGDVASSSSEAAAVTAEGESSFVEEEVVMGEQVEFDSAAVDDAVSSFTSPSDISLSVTPTGMVDFPHTVVVSASSELIMVTSASPTPPTVDSDDIVTIPASFGTLMNELESLSSSRVLQENHSGSARTDFCSNHKKMDRLRKRKQMMEQQDLDSLLATPEFNLHHRRPRKMVITDVRSMTSEADLTAFANHTGSGMTSVASGLQYACGLPQSQLLQDDPPSHGDLYQDEGLLTSMANDLAVPISLLSEVSVVDPSTVSEFTGTTINLQDLE